MSTQSQKIRGTQFRSLASTRTARRLAAVGLVLVFVASALALAPGGGGLGGLAVGTPVGHAVLPGHVVPAVVRSPATHLAATAPQLAPPHPPAPITSSGPGTFYTTSSLPNAATGSQFCYFGSCANVSNNPSANITTKGLLAIAYTAYTNASPCLTSRYGAATEIGFVRSSNLGATWSAPRYLGNPDCVTPGSATNYTSAWEPSLTSLSDGTLALAYIEYNRSNPYTIPPAYYYGYFGSFNIIYDRLVITYSHDNGTTWTTPTVLNSSVNTLLNNQSWAPARPSIAAFGNTIYVTWMNVTQDLGYNFFTFPPIGSGSAAVHLLVSKTAGATWLPMVNLSVQASTSLRYAMNPSVTVASNGEVFVAYVTNLVFHYQYQCYGVYCLYYTFSGQIVVASSTSNGTSLNYTNVGPAGAALWQASYAARAFNPSSHDPSPQLYYSPVTHQLYLTYGGGWVFFYHYTFGNIPSLGEQAYIANSSNLGVNWTNPHLVSPALGEGPGPAGGSSFSYNPAISVNSTGVLQLEATWVNESACVIYFGYPNCGVKYGVALTSTDNGSTFTNPVPLSFNTQGVAYNPDGEYQSVVSAGGHTWFIWTSATCPLSYPCYWFNPSAIDQIGVSQLFTGAGKNVTYVEKGLAAGVRWTINVDGNIRSGLAPTNLTISQVPVGEFLTWAVSNASGGYGVRYSPTGSIKPPTNLTNNLTIYENYSKQFLVIIASNPAIPGCSAGVYLPICFNYTYYPEVNYNMQPIPGSHWAKSGTVFNLSVVPSGQYCFFFFGCYHSQENLSFLSWTGTGAGAVNSLSHNISISPTGPVNETANFRFVAYCTNASGVWTCDGLNETILFHETGLPKGVKWGAEITSATIGASASNYTTNATLAISSNATTGIVDYEVFSVPAPGTGKVWVATTTPASPVELPGQGIINVTFALVNVTTVNFGTKFMETGLPNATAWTLSLDGGTFGVQGTTWNLTIPGGSHSVNGSYVYLNGGTSYYAQGVDVLPGVLNLTWQNTSAPSVVNLQGPSLVVIHYAPMYWVTVGGNTGGTVSPVSQYVKAGASVTVTATPNPGYEFVGWSGTGGGARNTNSTTLSAVVSPSSPVTEFATFRPIPPATFTVHVKETGLPGGVTYSVVLGGVAYSSTVSSFNVSGFNGTYALTLPYAALNATNLTRFVPTLAQTTFSSGAGGLSIVQDGWLNLTYSTQFVVSLISTGNGTIAPTPGNYWTNAGANVALAATPDPHYRFVGWVGQGNGSVNTTLKTTSVTANGPLTETAQFVWRPATPPAVYWLKVTESNLPSGTPWNVSTGALGSYGTTALLTVSGLNGTYNVTVPDVYVGQGTRWVADHPSQSLAVTANGTLTVAFSEEFEVTVSGSSGGTVGPASSQWVAKGGSVTLTATAASGYTFAGWNGTGTGAYTGSTASPMLTVTGPVTETATFNPVYPTTTTGSASAGETTAFAILAVLAVVGLLVGLIVGRRRAQPPVQAWQQPPEGSA